MNTDDDDDDEAAAVAEPAAEAEAEDDAEAAAEAAAWCICAVAGRTTKRPSTPISANSISSASIASWISTGSDPRACRAESDDEDSGDDDEDGDEEKAEAVKVCGGAVSLPERSEKADDEGHASFPLPLPLPAAEN